MFPRSSEKKIQKISNLLQTYSEQQGLEFSISGVDLYNEEVFSYIGGLSLFLVEAKEIYEKVYNNLYTVEELMAALGNKIKEPSMADLIKEQEYLESRPKDKIFPIDFHEQNEGTHFGFVPKLSDDIPIDFSLMCHFAHYSLEEYVKIYKKNKLLLVEGKIPLDPLYEKMMLKFNSQKITIVPAPNILSNNSDMNQN